MNPGRAKKIKAAAFQRQFDLTVVLENVHDPHNIGAVMRSCDAVGIHEIFVLYTEPHLTKSRLRLGKRTSSGARKWLKVHLYNDAEICFQHLKEKYINIYSTQLSDDAVSLYELDLTAPTALVFGNEAIGLSDTCLSYCDRNFIIPQMGMVSSLNISVACAITAFEAMRQRLSAGAYTHQPDSLPHQTLHERFIEIHKQRKSTRQVWPSDSEE